MPEIDHNAIKSQMVAILQADSNIYDINISDFSKFTYLKVGEPNGEPLPIPDTFPGLWVTNSRPLETIKPSGTITNESHEILTHDVDYEIKWLVNEEDSITTEKLLDTLQKGVMEALEADIRFQGTQWATSTSYSIGDIISYQGKLYEANADHTSSGSNTPPDNPPWTFLTNLPNDSWPSRVDTLRQNQDGRPLRGRVITWKCKFTT